MLADELRVSMVCLPRVDLCHDLWKMGKKKGAKNVLHFTKYTPGIYSFGCSRRERLPFTKRLTIATTIGYLIVVQKLIKYECK